MDYIFFQTTGINGFDSFGHYLRAALIVNQCTNYVVEPVGGCSAKFTQAGATSALAAASAGGDRTLEATARALAGLPAQKKLADRKPRLRRHRARTKTRTTPRPEATPTPTPAPAATPTPAPTAPPSEQDKTDALLDYLFGGDR